MLHREPESPYEFSPEPGPKPPEADRSRPWIVLIVDDDEAIHDLTEAVLRDVVFDGRGLSFLSAFSAREGREILSAHPEIELILLDVVMEADDAGLKLVRWIRQDQGNALVRILLRTGQPGKAPERSVILDYDINDYHEKTELTYQKLFSAVISCLRSHRDLSTIETNQNKLEALVRSHAGLFQSTTLEAFSFSMLRQLATLAGFSGEAPPGAAWVAVREGERLLILGQNGLWDLSAEGADWPVPEPARSRMREGLEQHCPQTYEDAVVQFFRTHNRVHYAFYLQTPRALDPFDLHLLDIFCANTAMAVDNLRLTREIEDTQKEIIYTLGEMIERRSNETGNHVKRVTEIARLLALKAGATEADSRTLAMAAPMHDIGKLVIPDAILHKAGDLKPEEREFMQTHTETGYDIFKASQRPVLRAAADIAYTHHEKWDGSGYPRGLAGEDIPFFGRIVAVADVFDALLSRRSYKEAWSVTDVRDFFERERGRHFDPRLTDLLLEHLDEFMAFRDLSGLD